MFLIIEQLAGNRDDHSVMDRETTRALAACASTCRVFSKACRRYIYIAPTIQISSRRRLEAQANYLKNCDRATSSVITALIIDYSFYPVSFSLQVPRGLRRLLPGLQSLTFIDSSSHLRAQDSVPYPEIFFVLLSHSRCVTQLTLRDHRFYSFGDLARFLSALPQLSSLILDGIACGKPCGDLLEKSTRFRAFRKNSMLTHVVMRRCQGFEYQAVLFWTSSCPYGWTGSPSFTFGSARIVAHLIRFLLWPPGAEMTISCFSDPAPGPRVCEFSLSCISRVALNNRQGG